MASLILMYLYYDSRGEIKGITPSEEESLKDFRFTTIPLKEVEMFLTGEVNPFDYAMRLVGGKPTKLVKKEVVKIQPRTQSQFLTRIEQKPTGKADIIVVINSSKRSINVSVNPLIMSLYNSAELS